MMCEATPPDVLFVAADLSTGGGVNKVIRDLAVLFRKQLPLNVSVVAARGDGESSYAFPADVPVERHPRLSLLAYFRLLLRLRRRRPRFVVGSWTQDNILIALAFLFSPTRVVVIEHASWHFHGSLIRLLRRLVYPLAWRLVVLNRRDLDHYRRHLDRVRLIPDPVVAPGAAARPREKLIIAVGHLEPIKNFEDAIRAMAQSGLEEEGWSLAIIGSGSEESKLRDLIRELGLKRTTIRTTREDLGGWYASASLLLVTSRIESFSLVLAEAMLSGVVPIVYASDGPSFILEDFPDHLVAIGDVVDLGLRLGRFARSSDLDTVRDQISQSISRRCSPDVVGEEWRQLLCDRAGAKS